MGLRLRRRGRWDWFLKERESGKKTVKKLDMKAVDQGLVCPMCWH